MPETANNARWFVLTVAPQHELAVKQHLDTKGFEASVPVYKVRRRWSDRLRPGFTCGEKKDEQQRQAAQE